MEAVCASGIIALGRHHLREPRSKETQQELLDPAGIINERPRCSSVVSDPWQESQIQRGSEGRTARPVGADSMSPEPQDDPTYYERWPPSVAPGVPNPFSKQPCDRPSSKRVKGSDCAAALKEIIDLSRRTRARKDLEQLQGERSCSHQYRTTFKCSWNQAEPPRSIIFWAVDGAAAAQNALLLAGVSEVVVDTVPLT